METNARLAPMNPTNSRITLSRYSLLFFLAFSFVILCINPGVHAQDSVVELNPATTKIEFTLDAFLHTVHGSFKLKSGVIQFNSSTGIARGAIVVDAISGESGNNNRDNRMHHEILESGTFSEIVFSPKQIKGALAAEGVSRLEVSGELRLLGRDHDFTLALNVESSGEQLRITSQAVIPYVQWGLKNPSTLVLRVNDKVNIAIRATGRLRTAATTN